MSISSWRWKMTNLIKFQVVNTFFYHNKIINFAQILSYWIFSFILLVSQNPLSAQNDDWQFYNEFGLPVHTIALEDSLLWISTGWSLIKLNLTSGDTTVYEMGDDWINTIEIDKTGNKWLGSIQKIIKFDNSAFTYYNLIDYGFFGFGVFCIYFDNNNHLWFGFDSTGVGHFDGTSWNIVDDYLNVSDIAVDQMGVKWICTAQGLEKYDNENWFHYDDLNSDFPGGGAITIAVDSNNNKWIGTNFGLAVYNDTSWTIYNTENAVLPNNNIFYIFIDQSSDHVPELFLLYQNYPNPFNLETVIKYNIARQGKVTINVYNVLGEKIKTLVNENKLIGTYEIRWDGTDIKGTPMPSGIFYCQMKSTEFIQNRKMILIK